MKIRISLLTFALVATCYAEEESPRVARAPQGHVQYSEPDGTKVNWKLYAPYTQWKAQHGSPERNQRAEASNVQQSQLLKQQEAAPPVPTEPPLQYKPYSMVPAHIKQLIYQMYQPQLPYVDPAAYVYQTYQDNQEDKGDEAQEESNQYQSQYYRSKQKYQGNEKKARNGFIQYKQDYQPKQSYRQQTAATEQSEQQYGAMPNEIQQLLYLQAQTPYHVIANRILYQPKNMFVPKPIPLDEKNPYKYHTKVYYLKDGTIEPEETTKPVEEDRGQY